MIQVDISNIWGCISLPELLGTEQDIFLAHNALSEDPAIGPDPEEISRILDAAERIRAESEVLVVLGSCSAARGALELLQGPGRNLSAGKNGLQIFFPGNSFSTRAWQEMLRLIEGKDLSLCVISHSGTDLAACVAFRNLKWLLERKYGTDESRQRIYAIAEPDSPLGQRAREEGWAFFPLREQSYPELSAGELLPMAAGGMDIRALLRGVSEAQEEFDLRSFENPVWLYTAARQLLHRGGKGIELLASFEPGFRAVAGWWQRLLGTVPVAGSFPVPVEYPGELELVEQLIRNGGGNFLETVVHFDPPEEKVTIAEDVRGAEEMVRLAEKTLDQVDQMCFQAMLEAHSDSGVPLVTIDCGAVSEEILGQLYRFFRLSREIHVRMQADNPLPADNGEGCQGALLRLLQTYGS